MEQRTLFGRARLGEVEDSVMVLSFMSDQFDNGAGRKTRPADNDLFEISEDILQRLLCIAYTPYTSSTNSKGDPIHADVRTIEGSLDQGVGSAAYHLS